LFEIIFGKCEIEKKSFTIGSLDGELRKKTEIEIEFSKIIHLPVKKKSSRPLLGCQIFLETMYQKGGKM
jgi:hypothetical protein